MIDRLARVPIVPPVVAGAGDDAPDYAKAGRRWREEDSRRSTRPRRAMSGTARAAATEGNARQETSPGAPRR
jgi:hypothetical protein